jgi:hypothetical protein
MVMVLRSLPYVVGNGDKGKVLTARLHLDGNGRCWSSRFKLSLDIS